MATTNAINYLKVKEDSRANRAREFETNRSNLANEAVANRNAAETERSNKAREFETNRANLAKEFETNRANLAKETENNRHNLQTEMIDATVGNSNIYKNQQQGNLLNAQTTRYDMENSDASRMGIGTLYGNQILNERTKNDKLLRDISNVEADTYKKNVDAAYTANLGWASGLGTLLRGTGSLVRK